MAETQVTIGYGAKVSLETEDSPLDFLELSEVFNITPPQMTVDSIEATHMQSPNRRREFVSGLIGSGECSFEMNYIPGSVSDIRLNEILDIPAGQQRRRQVLITYPNGETHQFSGELTGYEPNIPTDDRMTATVTFTVTGDVTRSY